MAFRSIEDLIFLLPAILLAVTFHEFAHGIVAYRMGDPTPKYQGRLTLNPMAHLDLMGTLLFVLAGFGWAKPVQVNPMNFAGDRRRGMMIVSLAGPFSNLVLAYLGALVLGLVHRDVIPFSPFLIQFSYALVWINVVLAVFNLLPIPPLDGSKILAGILPRQAAYTIDSLEQFGPLILILLIITRTTSKIILPAVQWVVGIIFLATGVPV